MITNRDYVQEEYSTSKLTITNAFITNVFDNIKKMFNWVVDANSVEKFLQQWKLKN
jgi:hypothetical protein